MSRCITGVSLAVLACALSACAAETPVTEVTGECADAYQGQVCTYASVQGTTVIDIGATVPIASIENAPADEVMESWPPVAVARLNLPESVREQTGLTELTMFWEAAGHPPGPYLTPHFDFHFYTIPPAEVEAIDCADLSKPAALPSTYSLIDIALPPEMAQMTGEATLVGLCVPKMGMHALLSSELESDKVFRGSLVLGYYAGKPIFVEPMLTKEMLMEKKSFELPIPEIPGLSGPHPTRFRAEWDAQQQAYHFLFSGFSAT